MNKGVLAEEVWDDGVKNTIGAVTGVSASSYCSKGSHLATRRELDTLRNTPATEQERSKYPVQRDYIVSNGAEYLTYNLKTGVTAPYTAGSQYVICVTETPINVVSWGHKEGADSSSVASQLTDVRAITANQRSYAALKGDGTVVTWGGGDGGNSSAVTDQLVDVKAVFGNGAAFAALKNDGTVVTWGDKLKGGDSNAVASQLTGVIDIIPNYLYAFAALKNDGTVVTWGDPERGGDSSSVADMLTDVSAVFGGQSFFIAQKKDGTIITWGGRLPTLRGGEAKDIKTMYAFRGGALALKHDGSWIGWGLDPEPLNAAGKQIVQLTAAAPVFSYAALTSDGKVIIGEKPNEGTSSTEDVILDPDGVVPSLTDVRRIYATGSTAYSYAALKNDGTVVTWFAGPRRATWHDDITASDSSAVSHLLTNVKTIYSTLGAFAALKEDGSVVTWGERVSGGDSSLVSGLLTDVKDIYFARYGLFSAVKNNGVVVTWGCGTRCGYPDASGDYTNVQTIPNLKTIIGNYQNQSRMSFAALLAPESE
ncbi:hypothetical protein ACTG2C_01110 [Aeromonas veronii]